MIVPQLLELLGEAFAEDVNTTSTGHKVLPQYIRMIQGDGISYESLGDILAAMEEKGWAAENAAFGSGGALLQKMNRDTQKCAFKCSELIKTVDGVTERVDVYKDPVTDKGKQSKKGRLSLEVGSDGKLTTMTQGQGDPSKDVMIEVFRNGKLLVEQTTKEIRQRAAIPGVPSAA